MAAQGLSAIPAPACVLFIGRSLCARALAEYVQRVAREVATPLQVGGDAEGSCEACEQPDVIVVCSSECSGFLEPDAFSEWRTRYPEAQLIAMSPRAHTASLVSAIDAGAKGFIACGIDSVEDVVDTLVGVLQGEIAFSTELSRLLIGELRSSGVGRRVVTAAADDQLTERERSALALLAQGRSNQQIASAMRISVNTVKNHLAHLYRKLGVSSRAEAVAEATRRRLV